MNPENAGLIPKPANLGVLRGTSFGLFHDFEMEMEKGVRGCEIGKLEDGESFQNLCLLPSTSTMNVAYGRSLHFLESFGLIIIRI